MPLEAQPPGRQGNIGRPYSALNLRLALASFGFVVCAVLAITAFRLGAAAIGVILAVLAVTAAVDIVVIQRRRAARRRTDPAHHSLFE